MIVPTAGPRLRATLTAVPAPPWMGVLSATSVAVPPPPLPRASASPAPPPRPTTSIAAPATSTGRRGRDRRVEAGGCQTGAVPQAGGSGAAGGAAGGGGGSVTAGVPVAGGKSVPQAGPENRP